LSPAADHEILDVAKMGGSTVVTFDTDFHQLLAISRATAPSVIRIRIEVLKADGLTQILLDVIAKCRDDIEAGAALSVDWKRIRVHRLPLP
jgi:predicted nuclease of predicted toxin-antitoxin system